MEIIPVFSTKFILFHCKGANQNTLFTKEKPGKDGYHYYWQLVLSVPLIDELPHIRDNYFLI